MNPKKIVPPLVILLFILLFLFSGCIGASDEDVELGPLLEIPEEYNALVNPIAADEASLKEGERLYGIYCDTCHGKSGSSGEKVTEKFEVRPTILSSQKVIERYTDGGHFYLIKTGVDGTNMRPFWELNDEEKWNIINYLKTLDSKKSFLDKIL